MTKNRKFKLTTKRYTISNALKVLKRHFLMLFSFLFLGISTGVLLYFVNSPTYYSTQCLISYSGDGLDDTQRSNISNFIVSNEQIDLYLISLAENDILNGNKNFSYSDLSKGLSSSVFEVSNDTKSVKFKVSFYCKEKSNSYKVLSVVSEDAVIQLNSIYYRDAFNLDYGSFSAESSFTIRNKNLLVMPIILSIALGFALSFFLDGYSDILFDYEDCGFSEDNTIVIKNNKQSCKKVSLFLTNQPNCMFLTDDSDFEILTNFINDKKGPFWSNGVNVLESKIVPFSKFAVNNQTKIPTIIYVVVLGKSSYFNTHCNLKALSNALDDNTLKLFCIDKGCIK